MELNILLKRIVNTYRILKKSVLHFGSNRPIGLAGTTAFFAIFSVVPILIIIISVFGYFTGSEVISQKLFNELNVLIGSESTDLLKSAITNYNFAEKSRIGTFIGVIFFLISATTLFGVLQDSINYIWRVKPKSNLKNNVLKMLKDRVLSFGVILCLGFILLVSLLVDASIAFFKDFLKSHFGPSLVILVQIINIIFAMAIITVIFLLIYRFLPDVFVEWDAALFGAIFSAIMFTVGKVLIGIIVGNSKLGVVYGAASSFVVLLIWIYYVSILFYFGVELTRQYSIFYQHKNTPLNFAKPFEITTSD
jgi:membrane protein